MVKFLVVRFSSIGDIVLTTPVVRCLKNQVEDAAIHYVTKKRFASLVEYNPHIDKVHTLSENLSKLIRELQKEDFDYIIDLHNNLRTAILKSRIKAVPFSFPKINWQKWLMVNFRINRLPDMHIVDRYMKTIRLFDVRNDNLGLDYFLSGKDEVSLDNLPDEFRKGFIAFSIGGMHNTKKLTIEKIEEICSRVQYPIVFLGGNEDHETAEHVIRKGEGDLINACGQYSINQSASLVKQSRLVITHDTGLMHIAAAFKKKIISIWGNTIPQFGMYPYLADPESVMVEVPHLSCRPCSKLGYRKCPKKHFRCINDIDMDRIEQLVEQLW